MLLPSERELQWYDKVKKPRPSHEEHGVSDTWEQPLSEFVQKHYPSNPRNWHMEGNILHCETDIGPFAQRLPTNVILIGEDEQGLPKFKVL